MKVFQDLKVLIQLYGPFQGIHRSSVSLNGQLRNKAFNTLGQETKNVVLIWQLAGLIPDTAFSLLLKTQLLILYANVMLSTF